MVTQYEKTIFQVEDEEEGVQGPWVVEKNETPLEKIDRFLKERRQKILEEEAEERGDSGMQVRVIVHKHCVVFTARG